VIIGVVIFIYSLCAGIRVSFDQTIGEYLVVHQKLKTVSPQTLYSPLGQKWIYLMIFQNLQMIQVG